MDKTKRKRQEKRRKKPRGRSVQELMGIRGFTRYGLATDYGELLFFRVSPVNISVLSASNIDVKIHTLQPISYMGDDHYGDSADFYVWRGHRAHAVMKDGTQIELLRGQNCEPVDLDQVDHVLLADGTKLPAPNTQ